MSYDDNFGCSRVASDEIREMQARLNEMMKRIADTPPPAKNVVLLSRNAVDRGFAKAMDDLGEQEFSSFEERCRWYYKRGLIDALKNKGRFEP